jgi:cob(I)alamin adenosyltransferase
MIDKLGLIHIYTGDGAGKTSAAVGKAVRARGRGLSVLVAQLFKSKSAEIKELEKHNNVKYMQYTSRHPFFKEYSQAQLKTEKEKCTAFIKYAFEVVRKEKYNFFIIDEAGPALASDLIDASVFIDLIKSRPKNTELIMTGRGFPNEFLELADYVTEMVEKKHPLKKGIYAREGVEL